MRFPFLALCVLLASFIGAAGEDYKLGADSEEHADIPKGTVSEYTFKDSQVFPGTTRKYWVYLPPGFNAGAEYPFMVFFDGGGCISAKGQFRVPTVFDNLIHKKEIPPLVGLFINPGEVPPVEDGAKGRSTRSFEYDTPDAACSKFVIEEMLPILAEHAHLSRKPEDHAAWGISSGGIAAFNLAWQRPDVFRKVISYIGSFTNIRGGFGFPAAVRKTERKPIRVFLQEGSTDLDNVHGNWPLSNQELAHALKFAGYDYTFTMGDGGHSGKQGGAIFPDALRWLWRADTELPKPTPEVPQDMALSGIVIPGETWQLVTERKKALLGACADADGNFYFSEKEGDGIYKIATDGTVSLFVAIAGDVTDMKFAPDGRLYACLFSQHQLVAFEKEGKAEVLAEKVAAEHLVVTHVGKIYFTEIEKNKVMLWKGRDKLSIEAEQLFPYGIALSPNQETLAVSDAVGNAIWAFRVEADGRLGAKMPVMPYTHFGRESVPEGGAMICDTRSRFYCSTPTGIETYDPNGRPIGVILPPPSAAANHLALAGPELNYLFVLSNQSVYKRKVNAKGFMTSAPPILSAEKKK